MRLASAPGWFTRSGVLRYAQLAPARRNLAIALCVLIASLADGFGIATLIPLIAVLGVHQGQSGHGGLAATMLAMMEKVGITPDPAIMLGIVVGGTLIKAALILLSLRQIGNAIADVTANLRIRLVDSIIAARWSYYTTQSGGRLANALSDESTKAGEAYSAAMLMVSQVMQALVYIGISALLSWQLAVFTLAVSAVMVASLNRFVRSARDNARTQAHLLRVVLARLSEVLLGIKPLKAMARDAHVTQLFQRDLGAMRKAERKQVFARNANRALQEPIVALCLVLGIVVALEALRMPLGEVIVLSLLLAKTALVVGRAQQQLNEMHAAEPGLKSVQRIIGEAQHAAEPPGGGLVPRFEREIRFRDVSFNYAEHPVLASVDASVPHGRITVLEGASGAGKTTFIDLLLGLHRPASGEILIDGVPLRTIDRTRWRREIGYAPQNVVLFHDTVAVNLTLGEARVGTAEIERALRDAACWEFVRKLPAGIDTVLGEHGDTLSGGQRQRLALARALVHRPRLLIVDEATSALDPATEARVIANLRRRVAEDRLTILAASHHSAWSSVADQVLRLHAGRLVDAA